MGKRERYSAIFKARAAIEAIKEKETLREFSERFNVCIMTISKWKGEFLEDSTKILRTDSLQLTTRRRRSSICTPRSGN